MRQASSYAPALRSSVTLPPFCGSMSSISPMFSKLPSSFFHHRLFEVPAVNALEFVGVAAAPVHQSEIQLLARSHGHGRWRAAVVLLRDLNFAATGAAARAGHAEHKDPCHGRQAAHLLH